ncbi:MAG: RnfABCDGE type electron transport complex subunit D [Candidatus Abyssobacteria bacterium SURF_17]|uniref:Ion-translocating oxidoreductase complex subunit D n=1 Tax=Candidatus Abyssobacteria bacterium SURF_17 TaxID=2093361 RepID=A0A419F1P9_9BACT|nr:MAG: RnfABCDGE type electron transport complex subunit D [Candidatus Abyssubacteria bacterium SURF_17]
MTVDRELVVTTSPHIRSDISVNRVMIDVLVALAPATAAGIYFFGFRSAVVLAVAVISAVVTEAAIQRVAKWEVAVGDYSACVTGLLLGMNLPPGVPLWIVAIGSAFAIAIAKLAFGGLGKNIFNPALAGRVMLLAAWPVAMTKGWLKPEWWRQADFSFWSWNVADRFGISVDVISSATPLVKGGAQADAFTLMDLFIGRVGGCIGETSALALLIGAAYLIYRRHIYWQLPACFVATVGVLVWFFGGTGGYFTGNFLMHIFAGGLILGAFFMATDMVTSPMTIRGQIIMGIGCGLLTFLVRLKGGPPEGVSYSILIMNALTPLIDRYTVPRRFGEGVA